eukprot:TRINITY_DN20792_c0_g1_i1.p1 TRINITY_DN20792_c0_g1~~TRINITY_DN20792_c0_g1_i1.p1  ORF type:complete len:358 (+),score=172.60 TRINITY_DN20792_c0_g1_i1:94-1167(+)
MLRTGVFLALALAATAQTEQQRVNSYMAQSPSYDLTDVTVNFMMVTNGDYRSTCYTNSGTGVWSRKVFREAARQAFNTLALLQRRREQGTLLINGNWQVTYPAETGVPAWILGDKASVPQPNAANQPNIYDNLRFDRVLESSYPFPTQWPFDFEMHPINASRYTNNKNFGDNYWNVMVRMTFTDVPASIVAPSTMNPSGFRPWFGTMFAPSTGNYTSVCPGTKLLWDSVWISTEDNFITSRLTPVKGRGHKNQQMLIPLIVGLACMLVIPVSLVALAVMYAQQSNENEAKIINKENEIQRKERELAAMNEQIISYQKKEEEKQARVADQKAKRKAQLEFEIETVHCGEWCQGKQEGI